MINAYKTYLENSAGSTLTIEDAMEIYDLLVEGIHMCSYDEKFEYWNDFLVKAAKYVSIRCEWETTSRDQRIEADAERTAVHNSFITATEVLARIIAFDRIEGLNAWRDKLGDDNI